MLRPASRPAHHSPWLPPVAFINSDRGDPSHTTTTGSWIGVDLEVRPPVAFINSDRGKPPLTPPPLGSGSKNSEYLLEVHDRMKMRAAMLRRCSSRMTNEGPGCSHDMGVVTRMLVYDQDEVRRSRALPSFLDANSVERVAIDVCTGQGEERHPKDRFALSVTKNAATTIPQVSSVVRRFSALRCRKASQGVNSEAQFLGSDPCWQRWGYGHRRLG